MATAPSTATYLDELHRLYEAETRAVGLLLRLCDAARAPTLREALARQCDESRLHLERLQLILTRWNAPLPSLAGGSGLAGLVQEADARLHEAETLGARDAAVVAMAQQLMQGQAARYGRARAHARRLDHADEARLLQATIDEDTRADSRLAEIVASVGVPA